MARYVIAESVAAGNAAYATIYTMPTDYSGFISNIVANNTTGGALNLTIAVKRLGTDYILYPATAVAGNACMYGKTAAAIIVPVTLNSGDIIEAMGSAAGLVVTISGLRFS